MRILHVNAAAHRAGGAEIFLFDLMDWQKAHGHVPALFATSTERAERGDDRCVLERPPWDATLLLEDPELEDAAVAFCERFRPDVIHLHNLYTLSVGLVVRLGELGIPLVHQVHDGSYFCANSWLTLPDGRVCEGGVGRKCSENGCESNYPYDARVLVSIGARVDALRARVDHWIAASRAYGELCERHGFDPVRVVPYWSPPPEPTEPASGPRAPRVLSVGRLVPEKGIEVLVRAWARVQREHPEAELRIAGDGTDRERLEGLARELGLEPSEIFLGRVPHERVDELMRGSRAFVVPSIWLEAFGITILEAQRAGLPPIVSRLGGMVDLVEHERSGLHVEPRDPDALAEAIGRLLSDDVLHGRLVAGGLTAAREREDDAPMHAVHEVYEAARVRGSEHRRPVDTDRLHAQARLMRDYSQVETWGLEMKKHLEYLEQTGTADQPLRGFARHLKFWLKSRTAGRA